MEKYSISRRTQTVNVHAAYIRGKHGAMKIVSMGDGLGNVASKI